MDLFILFLRIAITLTFLILAIFGPVALTKLTRFIRRYTVAHEAMQADIEELKKWRDAHEDIHD